MTFRRRIAACTTALTAAGLLVAGGAAGANPRPAHGGAGALTGPAERGTGHGNHDMARMHQLMSDDNPGMARMHELLPQGNPGMVRMHHRMATARAQAAPSH